MQGRKYSPECLRVQTAGETRIGTRERFSSTKEYTPIISGHKMRPDGEIQAADAEALYSGLPADLEVADVETPLAVLDDRDRDAVKVRLVVRGLEVGVGMAADHEIHIAGTADEHLIQIRLVLETDVGEGDDEIVLLLGLEVLGPLVDHLGVLEGGNPVGDILGDKNGDVRHEAYDPDAHTGLLDDGVRLDVLGQGQGRGQRFRGGISSCGTHHQRRVFPAQRPVAADGCRRGPGIQDGHEPGLPRLRGIIFPDQGQEFLACEPGGLD